MSSTFTVPVIGQTIDLRINNKPTMVIDVAIKISCEKMFIWESFKHFFISVLLLLLLLITIK